MAMRAFLLLTLLASLATAQVTLKPARVKPVVMTVPGSEAVITVTALPFTITAPPEPAYFLFTCPAGFEVTRKANNSLIVDVAPNGTHTVTLTTLPHNPGPGRVRGEGKITLVVNVAAAPGTAPPPVTPVAPVPAPVLSLPPLDDGTPPPTTPPPTTPPITPAPKPTAATAHELAHHPCGKR